MTDPEHIYQYKVTMVITTTEELPFVKQVVTKLLSSWGYGVRIAEIDMIGASPETALTLTQLFACSAATEVVPKIAGGWKHIAEGTDCDHIVNPVPVERRYNSGADSVRFINYPKE